jgi:hypothetical protein
LGVHPPKGGLCAGKALLGCLPIPAGGFLLVLRHTPAFNVHFPDLGLSASVALFGGLAKQG